MPTIHKHFRFSIFVRVLIIISLSVAFAFVLVIYEMLFVPLALGLGLMTAVFELLRYIERSNKDLTQLLLAVRQRAYTESVATGGRGKSYEELSDAVNEVITDFARLNEEKEIHFQYLQALNENIGVAILTFDAEGQVLMMNPAAKALLRPSIVRHKGDLSRIDPVLHETVMHIKPEERMVANVFIAEEQHLLSVQAKEMVLRGKHVQIILLQNLRKELEQKEIEAWHELMSVLTHEIMNSVTPLVSLSAAIKSILENPDGTRKDWSSLDAENADDIRSSLTTIESRSKGLLRFVNAYKEYAKPIAINLESSDVRALVQRAADLLTPDLQKFSIRLYIHAEEKELQAKMDVALLEQVLINLIKNAIEAVPHDGSGEISVDINLKARDQMARIAVNDNGAGIEPDVLRKIFIPFYTTKTKGTGIGLSLCRQIMSLHNGNIAVQSVPGSGTVFTIEWRW